MGRVVGVGYRIGVLARVAACGPQGLVLSILKRENAKDRKQRNSNLAGDYVDRIRALIKKSVS
jgi:hypothetical protein